MDGRPYVHTVADSLAFEDYDAGEVAWLRQETHGDRSLWCGFWRVRPDELADGTPHESAHDETFIVLDGKVSLSFPDGADVVLSRGDAITIAKGTTARWTVLEPLLEFFVYT